MLNKYFHKLNILLIKLWPQNKLFQKYPVHYVLKCKKPKVAKVEFPSPQLLPVKFDKSQAESGHQ